MQSKSELSIPFTINTKHLFLYANYEKNVKVSSQLFCKAILRSSFEQMFLKKEKKLNVSMRTWSDSFSQKEIEFCIIFLEPTEIRNP